MEKKGESPKLSTYVLIEPFCGGSHKQLIDQLVQDIPNCSSFTLPGKKWHWRARTSAVYFSQIIPRNNGDCKTLFASSVLNLAELIALRPDLSTLHKVLYFHENQLVYPVRKQQERDFQYGYNQIISSLVADTLVFNSQYNKNSFLENIKTFLKLIPDHRPSNLAEELAPKCQVVHFPLSLPPISINPSDFCKTMPGEKIDVLDKNLLTDKENSCLTNNLTTDSLTSFSTQKRSLEDDSLSGHAVSKSSRLSNTDPENKNSQEKMDGINENTDKISSVPSSMLTESESKPLHIVWPHRWEHDKDPETLFEVLLKLHEEGLEFSVSVIGQTFSDVPNVFAESRSQLLPHIKNWGFVESKTEYYDILKSSDVVVSTAKHEFYGVAMLEAVYFGCYPLCPNRLVYPEIFPGCYLYNTSTQLYKRLKEFCKRPFLPRNHHPQVDFEQFTWKHLKKSYCDVLNGI